MRFPGFEKEWEKKRLGDTIEFKAGYAFSSDGMLNEKSTYQLIKMSNVYRNELRLDRNPSFWSDLDKKQQAFLLKKGDTILTLTGTMGKRDFGYSVQIIEDNKYLLNQRLTLLREKKGKSANDFIRQLVSNEKFLFDFFETAKGGTGNQTNVGIEDVKNLSFYFPSEAEQKKIAFFLSLINERIETQSKIIEQFKSLISELTDDIFSDQTDFGTSTNSWVTYSVSEILEFFPTNSVSWENLDYEDGELFNLHYGMIHKSQKKLMDANRNQLPYIKKGILSKKPVLCRNGDVVFADASEDLNDVGKVVEFINCADHEIASGLHTIHARDKMDLTIDGFKAFAFSSEYFKNQIKRLAHGTKVYSISVKKLQECTIRIPSKEVQLKIVGILKGLEAKIDIESNILHQLKQQKGYLLKNLFK